MRRVIALCRIDVSLNHMMMSLGVSRRNCRDGAIVAASEQYGRCHFGRDKTRGWRPVLGRLERR